MGGYLKLIPYAEVRRRIIGAVACPEDYVEAVPVDEALGRVSAEEVDSPRDIPAVTTSMMDGYAVKASELRRADAAHPVSFEVKGALAPASVRPHFRLSGRASYYVATGAPVPFGADTVVKVEETRLTGDRILVSLSLPRWKNIAQKGDDVRAGFPIISRGHIVNGADIALLIGAGKKDVAVVRRPKVGVLSTGDELTDGPVVEGMRVNNYANLIAAYLNVAGATPVMLGVARDDEAEISRRITEGIGSLDALVTIGGSSVGRKDFTTNALRSVAGCEELFHGVRLVPARPTGMFMVGRKPIILLPGHSVAAALAFFLVVFPLVNILLGLQFDSRYIVVRARIAEPLANPRPIGALHLARLEREGDVYTATPLRWGSNLLSSLAGANAFFELDPRRELRTGQYVAVTLLGPGEIERVCGGTKR